MATFKLLSKITKVKKKPNKQTRKNKPLYLKLQKSGEKTQKNKSSFISQIPFRFEPATFTLLWSRSLIFDQCANHYTKKPQ